MEFNKIERFLEKKEKEKAQVYYLIKHINKEFCNDVILSDWECPDFYITLPNKEILGIEVTECCPSQNRKGSSRKKLFLWEDKVKEEFQKNEYFINKTKEQKLYILIYTSQNIKHHNIKEFCQELEFSLRKILDNPNFIKGKENLSTNIKTLKIWPTLFGNVVNFNHIARRVAVKASDILYCVHTKEEKLKKYDSQFKNNTWLCIYLPFEENRHSYYVDFDDKCNKNDLENVLKNSHFKRIYLTSVFEEDLRCIKNNDEIDI